MADKRPKIETITTPRGVFQYPHLTKPDTKFAKPENPKGDYKASIICDAPKSAGLIAKIDKAAQEKFDAVKAELTPKAKSDPKAKKALSQLRIYVPYEAQLDPKTGEENGKVKFATKVNAEGRNKDGDTWDNKPALFDASGTPIEKNPYGGSEGKLSIQIIPFYNAATGDAGVTLRLKAAQVLKMVAAGQKSASQYGFENEDEDDDTTSDDDADTSTGSDDDSAADDDVEF